MTDKTEKLLEQMCDVADELDVRGVLYAHEEARYEYERLAVEDDFLTGPRDDAEFLAEDFTAGVEAAEEHGDEFRDALHDFDKTLMKLIQLRGKLAEQLDIPIGGAKWVRLETYEM